jgi:secreted trypsin-like serine protease
MKTVQVLIITVFASFAFADKAWDVDWSQVKIRQKAPGVLNTQFYKPKMMARPAIEKDSKIVGGWEVVPNAHPYQVGLLLGLFSSDRNMLCGGSILNSKTILTAAHCTEGTDRAQIILGAHNISSTTELSQQRIDVNSTQYRPHFGYNNRNLNNDICIILLNQEITFNEFVQPIELPRSVQLRDRSFVTELATVR